MRFPRVTGQRIIYLICVVSTAAVATDFIVKSCSGDDVETVAEDQTKHEVEEYARQVATAAGQELKAIGDVDSVPCTGRNGESSTDIYTIYGMYQLPVPRERHASLFAELREQWRSYRVETYRASASEGGELALRTPDQFRIHFETAVEGRSLALMINSPCRRSPARLF